MIILDLRGKNTYPGFQTQWKNYLHNCKDSLNNQLMNKCLIRGGHQVHAQDFSMGEAKIEICPTSVGGRQAWTKIQNRHPSKIVKENWQILVNKDFTLPPEQVQRGQRQTHLPPVHATGGQKYNRLGLGASSRLLSSPFPYNRWEMYNVFVYIFFNSGSQGKGGGM